MLVFAGQGSFPGPPATQPRIDLSFAPSARKARATGGLTDARRRFWCLAISGLEPRSPVRNVGEQIDGSVVLDGDTYLVEAKWVADRVGNRDIHAFHGKLDGKAQWARGPFVSDHGFAEKGLVSFGTGKKAICMEGRDLDGALK